MATEDDSPRNYAENTDMRRELKGRADAFQGRVGQSFAALATAHREPQELTFEEFAKVAKAEKLEGHGRQWRVDYPNRGTPDHCFSDATDRDGAVRDAHRTEVNNALCANTPAAKATGRGLGADIPAMPPQAVLDEYPDLVALFPEAFGQDGGVEEENGGDSPSP